MTKVGSVLLLLSVWGYLFVLCRMGKLAFWFAPVLWACGAGLVLFIGALGGHFPAVCDGLLAGGLPGFGYFVACLVRGKVSRPRWTFQGVCVTAGMAAFAFLSLGLRLTHYDNFSHWALAVKYLLLTGELPGAETALLPFRDYPPGSSLFVAYICRYMGHSQGQMLLAQNSLLLACFLAVFGMVRERRRFLLYSFPGMGLSLLSYLNLTVRINNLLVDFLLPLLALSSMAYSRREENNLRLCAGQILLLGFTGIVKDTGLFFAGAAGIYAFWRLMRNSWRSGAGGRKGAFLLAVVLAAGTAGPALAWQYHVRTGLAGFEGKFHFEGEDRPREEGKELEEGGDPAGEELWPQIRERFWQAATDPRDRAFQAFVLCTLLALGASVYGAVTGKRGWGLPWALAWDLLLLAVYYGGMLGMYLYLMPEEEALRLAGFERYACSGMTLYAGILLLQAVADLEGSFTVDIDLRGAYRAYASPASKRRYQYAVLGTFLLGINFLYSEYNGLIAIRYQYEESLPGRAEALAGDRWYEGGRTDPARYLIVASDEEGQVSSGEVRYVFRYFLWAEEVDVTTDPAAEEEAGTEYDHVLDIKLGTWYF